jgi:thiol-disulfide isomerase/thioredoxin
MKPTCFGLALLCPWLALAQPRPLAVGDTLPPFSTNNVLNTPLEKLGTVNLSGRYTMLEFMATHCTSCLHLLPRLQQLQQQYKDKLQVVLVTAQSTRDFSTFLKKTTIGHQLYLPVITDDTLLTKYFPHRIISHLVWLDPNNRVLAITGPEQVTHKNVEALVNGSVPAWPVKDDWLQVDYSRPFFGLDVANIPPFSYPQQLYYQAFAGYMPGLMHGRRIDTLQNGTIRVRFVNLSRPQLFLAALGMPATSPVRVTGTGYKARQWFCPPDILPEEWSLQNRFCYEGTFSPTNAWSAISQRIQDEISAFLDLTVKTVSTHNGVLQLQVN